MSSKPTPSPLPEPTELERTAAEWLARVDAGMTAAEETALERWLAADVRHAEMFAQLDGTWSLIDDYSAAQKLSETSAPGADNFVPAANYYATPPARRKPAGHRRAVGLAFAAVALVGLLAAFSLRRFSPFATMPPPYAAVLTSELGKVNQVSLPDGSAVLLNTDTSLEVAFTATERRVRLVRGEAHFAVAKNPARPFVVHASGVAIRAVGTAFDVRLRDDAVDVLVSEGRVRVDDANAGRTLLAAPPSAGDAARAVDPAPVLSEGQKVTIALAPHATASVAAAAPVAATRMEATRFTAWQEKRLTFVSATLAEIAAEMNRYNRQQLVIPDRALAAEHFGGTFRADDLRGFVRVLENTFNLVAEESPTSIVLKPAQ